MSYVFLRWKDFKKKAFTLSYDDGMIADRRLVKVMNEYGLKGTFNINGSGVGKENKISADEFISLYESAGHEIAVHGEFHYSFDEVPSSSVINEVSFDRKLFESVVGHPVTGLAYPNGSFGDKVAEILKICGIEYARTIKPTYSFTIPENWLQWHPTCFHKDGRLPELTEEFLKERNNLHYFHDRPYLFYVWGHSYEFDRDDCWHIIEDLGKKVGNRDDIWYATNGEIYDYCKAYNSLVYGMDGKVIKNPSATDVFINYFGKPCVIPSGKTVEIL